MNKFVCTVEFTALEGQLQNLIDEMLRQRDYTKQEKGCIDYQILIHAKDNNKIFIIETYSSKEALDKHFQTEHVKAFFKEAATILVDKASHETYTVI